MPTGALTTRLSSTSPFLAGWGCSWSRGWPRGTESGSACGPLRPAVSLLWSGSRTRLSATASMVARQAAVHFALGVGTGVACIFGFARLTSGSGSGQVTGYHLTSASTLAAVAALLAIITAIASIAPAWRACRVDPARTLRES